MILRQLLDQSLRLDAEYGQNLSSHLPMGLTALARLGAADARLADFAQCYARRLRPKPPSEPWPAGEPWKSRFGDPRAWPAYRSLFNEWIDDEGAPAVLAQALPALMGGVGAAAFHGPIRTAYAIAAGHSHELAEALAYWACRWFALGEPPTAGRERDAAAVLARFDFAKPRQPLIAERMAQVANQSAFAGIAATFCIDDPDTTLAQLAALAARLYAATDNFTVLHLVTSAHALRVLLPWLDVDERSQAAGLYWLAYAAGHAASGLTHRASAAAPVALRPWPEIVSQAIASDDDHFIKLVDSCREQERAYGGAVWREAASRALQSA